MACDLTATLVERSWLFRAFDVRNGESVARVLYNGAGRGYESAWVDGKRVAISELDTEHLFRFVAARLDFKVHGRDARFEIATRWWFIVRGFRLWVEDTCLYSDGEW
jgi:hypothetical protein